MSILLSTFRQLAASVQAEAAGAEPPEAIAEKEVARKEQHARSRKTLSGRAEDRYAAVFATPTTSVDAAPRLGVTHPACNTQLYRYEARGLVEKVGEISVPGANHPATLWQWKAKKCSPTG